MNSKVVFFSFSKIYNFIPLTWLLKLSGKRVILPFYHCVSDDDEVHIKHLYKYKNTIQFKEDLTFFTKHFQPLSIEDFIENKNRYTTPSFLLSFDDGLQSFYKTVAPILKEKSITSINFLNSDFVDNKALFYRYKVSVLIDYYEKSSKEKKNIFHNFLGVSKNVKIFLLRINYHQQKILDELALTLEIDFNNFLQKNQPYLTSSQIRHLIDKGFSFGAHSESHPLYASIDIETQLSETRNSLYWVEENFKPSKKIFAFPFTDFGVSKMFFKTLEEENITSFGTAGIKDDFLKNHYQRIPMEYIKMFSAETIVKGELILYLLKRIFFKHKIERN